MDVKHYKDLKDDFIRNIFHNCLDKVDYACFKDFLEKSDPLKGGFGGVIPVYRVDMFKLLKNNGITEPDWWIETMIDFGFIQRVSVPDCIRMGAALEAYLVNPQAKNVLNLKYIKEHENI